MNKILNAIIGVNGLMATFTLIQGKTLLAFGFAIAATGWAYNKEKLLEQQKGE